MLGWPEPNCGALSATPTHVSIGGHKRATSYAATQLREQQMGRCHSLLADLHDVMRFARHEPLDVVLSRQHQQSDEHDRDHDECPDCSQKAQHAASKRA